METIRTTVCVTGGGPAGVMLGLLLAREGVDVTVLEKHADFFRDFRGDTVHPSTLNLIDALGLRAGFDAIPHAPLPKLDAVINGIRIHAIDFSSLPAPNRFVTLMPQWDLLDLLADAAATHPSFHLRMEAEVTDVIMRDGRVTGVRAHTPDGDVAVGADLVVAADGRFSTVRHALGLSAREHGVPADVLWFRVPRPAETLPDTLAWAGPHGVAVTIPRPEYLQCALLIPKGAYDGIRAEGIDAYRARVARIVPRLAGVVEQIASFDDVKLLSVQINRLPHWSVPGALCIGDAAHAMSPIFGVGINFAVQDAVATARALTPLLRSGADPAAIDPAAIDPAAIDRACRAVQRRRAWPTALIQRIQQGAHHAIASGRIGRVIHNPPTRIQRTALRVGLPVMRPLLARMVGYGFRPERLR